MEAQRRLDFEALKISTLCVVEKLQHAHEMQVSGDERQARRDEPKAIQFNELSMKLDKMIVMGGKLATECQVLDSLCFASMAARHAKIVEAHAQTFEWILRPRHQFNDLSRQNDFYEWLVHGTGLFWISGKAGSGKSTLMKFLSDHTATKQALEEWAGDKELVTASFYFWHAGTELRKSQEGLLQSLRHEILTQCPSLIPVILPGRWKTCVQGLSISKRWSRLELTDAFRHLSHHSMLTKKFCFFVDGLDEYDGDHTELISLIHQLNVSTDLKVCASSRPWNVFEIAFGSGSNPKIRLQDLTRGDIRLYVRETLEESRLFILLQMKERQRCKKLVHEVVERADGVFLWVFLVVRSLLQGLTNADRIADLQRRLHRLPVDLNEYFQHMFETIDDHYREQTAKTFQIALHASDPLALMTYNMLDELEDDPDFAFKLRHGPMHSFDIRSRHENMKKRINARCMDLLEVTRAKKHEPGKPGEQQGGKSDIDESADARRDYKEPFSEYVVDFLHRTVRDFLQLRETQALLTARMPRAVDLDTLLCQAFLAQVKIVPLGKTGGHRAGTFSDLLDDMVHYAHRVETNMAIAPTRLLDELAIVIAHRNPVFLRSGVRYGKTIDKNALINAPQQLFLSLAIQWDLQLYVAEKLENNLPKHDASGLILNAINPNVTSKYRIYDKANREMVGLLFRRGVSLNKEGLDFTHWNIFLAEVFSDWDSVMIDEKIFRLEIIKSQMNSGRYFNAKHMSMIWVEYLLKSRITWLTGSAEYEIALTETIKMILDRGADPNSGMGDAWQCFLKAIYGAHLSVLDGLTTKARDCIFKCVEAFLRRGADRHCILYNSGNAEELKEATELGGLWRAKQSLIHSGMDDTFMENGLYGQDEYGKGFRGGGMRDAYWNARENETNEMVENKKMEEIEKMEEDRKAKERQIQGKKDHSEATDLVKEDNAEAEELAMSELFPGAQVAPLMLYVEGKAQEQSVDAEPQERYWETGGEEVTNVNEAMKIEEDRKAEERRIQQEQYSTKVTELTVKELLMRIFPRRAVTMLLRTPVEPLTEESQDLPYRFSDTPSSADFITSILAKRSVSELEDESSSSEIETPSKRPRGS